MGFGRLLRQGLKPLTFGSLLPPLKAAGSPTAGGLPLRGLSPAAVVLLLVGAQLKRLPRYESSYSHCLYLGALTRLLAGLIILLTNVPHPSSCKCEESVMGMIEGLAIWAGVSILFCIGVGKLLHGIDHIEQRRSEVKPAQEPSNLVGMHPSLR